LRAPPCFATGGLSIYDCRDQQHHVRNPELGILQRSLHSCQAFFPRRHELPASLKGGSCSSQASTASGASGKRALRFATARAPIIELAVSVTKVPSAAR
jgi:hypothetical protein